MAAHVNGSRCHVIQTADQIDQTGLRAARAAQDPYRLACPDLQTDVMQHRIVFIIIIGKVHIAELDVTRRHFIDRIDRISQITFFIQHFADPSGTGNTHTHHDKDHGYHHQAHQNIHAVSHQTHQLARRQFTLYDHLRSHPADQQDAGVDRKLHDRHIQDDVLLRLNEDIVDGLAGPLQLGSLVLFPHVSLHHTDGADILLHGSIQLVVFRKSHLEIFHRSPYNKEENDRQQHKRYQINRGQPGIDQISHGHGADHADRCPETDAQEHLICHLDIRHVRSHPGDQPRRAELIQIGKGKCLDILEHRLPQIACKPGGSPGSELTSHDTGKKAAQRRPHHKSAYIINVAHIPCLHAVVYDRSHHKRDQHLKNNLQDHKNRRQNGCFLKFLNLRRKCFDHTVFLSPFFYCPISLFNK